jgi:methionyl-tRNA formyltransferase
LLPKYKGADPIFWQIKNMEKYGGISVHVMTEDIDSGPIVLREELAIIPGETYGLYAQRLAALAAEKVAIVPDMLKAGTLTIEQKADEPALFYKAPSPTDLRINWQEQNAGEIENLVNATNPRYGGAFTSIRQSQVNLLEVAPADINNPTGEQIAPGTIVHADVMYGLIVACTNHQFLKINVVHVQQGYLSGSKMFNLGFRAGEVFV